MQLSARQCPGTGPLWNGPTRMSVGCALKPGRGLLPSWQCREVRVLSLSQVGVLHARRCMSKTVCSAARGRVLLSCLMLGRDFKEN